MRQLEVILTLFLLLLLTSGAKIYSGVRVNSGMHQGSPSETLSIEADKLFHEQNYSRAVKIYRILLQDKNVEKAAVLKKMALAYAALNNPGESVAYIKKYLLLLKEFNYSFLKNEGFENIKNSREFKDIEKKYAPKVTVWSFIYLYVALIGFYIAVIINFNRKIDVVAKILISGFIFIHSFFIFHICLHITNYQYEFPHSYLMSISFSFLYGPLLYFYFKRITQQYRFRKIDLLHLIPTVLFLIHIIPIYAMSANDKLDLMLGRVLAGRNAGDSEYLALIVGLKLTSLIVYGYFIGKLYRKSRKTAGLSDQNRFWQRNIYRIHIAYIISYAIYGILISNDIMSGFFYHSQVICMAFMVLYVGYSANVQPDVFSGIHFYNNHLFFKYKNSGLTESLSTELKENLIRLFDEFKVYKENDISLETLAKKLNTTRHNASQVINEHFKMNFHELINTYRIQEAKEILNNDHLKNLNIIDIAYEVGYNNKVTFNKAFKKDTDLTPTEYQKKTINKNVAVVNQV